MIAVETENLAREAKTCARLFEMAASAAYSDGQRAEMARQGERIAKELVWKAANLAYALQQG